MAEWTFTPLQDGFTIKSGAPPTLISKYEDESEHRREKANRFPRQWTERYQWTDAEAESALDFWEARGLLTAFTKLSRFPNEPGGHEETVRFAGALELEANAPGEWTGEVSFEKVF